MSNNFQFPDQQQTLTEQLEEKIYSFNIKLVGLPDNQSSLKLINTRFTGNPPTNS